MTDLTAIRARHEEQPPLLDSTTGQALKWRTPFCRCCTQPWPCDAILLAAEVDRLTARLAAVEGKLRETRDAAVGLVALTAAAARYGLSPKDIIEKLTEALVSLGAELDTILAPPPGPAAETL